MSGQTNLVPNPSFEDTVYCPYNLDLLEAAYQWINPTANTPDYYHPCAPAWVGNFPGPSVPINAVGFQEAYSGQAYVGFGTKPPLKKGTELTAEYLHCHLDSVLNPEITYYFEMHVSFAEYSGFAMNHIGVYFSPELVEETTIERLMVTPQFTSGSELILDTSGWQLVSGNFTVTEPCEYMTIGRFREYTNADFIDMDIAPVIDYVAYYYIDNVSVSRNTVNILTNEADLPMMCSMTEIVQEYNKHFSDSSLQFFNVLGQVIFETSNVLVSMEDLKFDSNLFLFLIRSENGKTISGKIRELR